MNKPNQDKIEKFIKTFKELDPDSQKLIFDMAQAMSDGNGEDFIKEQYEKGNISSDLFNQIRRESPEPAKE